MLAGWLKKTTGLIVFCVVCISILCMPSFATGDIWDGSSDTGFASGSGTESDPYIIETAEQLAFFALSVNGGNSYEGKYIDLASDIILNRTSDSSWTSSATVWQPIGSKEAPFAGVFDGCGFTVKGMYINGSALEYAGLFGYSKGDIYNVTVADSFVGSGRYIGGICGYGYEGIIVGCTSGAELSGMSQSSEYVGGICGYKNDGAIIDCINLGNISGATGVGGVCGASRDTVYNSTNYGSVIGTGRYVGGVCGWSFYSISGCENYAVIAGKSFTGGICGVNYGNITESKNANDIIGNAYTGGVCGYNLTDAYITNSYNTGTVSGTGYTGGVCGISYEFITDCYNTGTVYGEKNVGGVCGSGRDISECYNAGKVSGTVNVGGISGENYSSLINICYNIGEIQGSIYTGGVCGYNYSVVMDSFNTGTVKGGINTGGICGRNDSGGLALCYNIGKITGEYFVGSVIGNNGSEGIVQECYYLSGRAQDSTDTVQNGIGYGAVGLSAEDSTQHTICLSEDEMKLIESFVEFDFSSVWTIYGDSTYLYPELRAMLFVSGIKLDKKEINLKKIGQKETLKATVSLNPALNTTVIWTSSNEEVATVDANGQVTAVGRGKAEIKASISDGSFWDVCAVTVTSPEITVSSASGRPGGTAKADIMITNNPGFISIRFKVICAEQNITLEKAENAPNGFSVGSDGVLSWSGDTQYLGNGRFVTLVFSIADPSPNADTDIDIQVLSCTDTSGEQILWDVSGGKLSVSNYKLGDINRDENVDVQDVTVLLRHINGMQPLRDTRYCDVNGDGNINIQDVIRLLNHVNGSDPFAN